MLLNDLLDYSLVLRMRSEGYVREQVHPDFPNLRILNYTEKAQFENVWNAVTLTCRGLIYDAETAEILARPFPKFFNYGQAGCPEIDLNAPATVMDKMDGSLGILYQTPDGNYAIATRGSFSSDQAIHATKILNDKYGEWLNDRQNTSLFKEWTPLFEIIYPENRIVCDYDLLDDLVLLDAVEISTGQSYGADGSSILLAWAGPVAEEFIDINTVAEALTAPPRDGAEGFVVLFYETGERVKIKQEEYVRLHRIITGLNARAVWAHLKEGKSKLELIETLPDEFHSWISDVCDDLNDEFDRIRYSIDVDYVTAMEDTRGTHPVITDVRAFRKTFADNAKKSPYAGFLFSILDSKDYVSKVWDMIRPEGNITPSGRNFTEETE